jgi:hypothetical protein
MLLALIGLLFFAPFAWAETEYEVKAAYTLRFADYVKWPESRGKVIVGIVGRDPFDGAFQRLLRESPDFAQRVSIRTLASSDTSAIRECSILFVSKSEQDRLPAIFRTVGSLPVLTVSDIENFEALGGHIGFTIRNSKVRFRVNQSAAEAQGLKLDKALVVRSAQ